jgi:hypothetical protein
MKKNAAIIGLSVIALAGVGLVAWGAKTKKDAIAEEDTQKAFIAQLEIVGGIVAFLVSGISIYTKLTD